MVCGHDELSALIENRWIDRLWHPHPPPIGDQEPPQHDAQAFSRADEAKWAVSVADRWEMQRLRGVAYYVCLMEMGDTLCELAQGGGQAAEHEDSEEESDTADTKARSNSETRRRHAGAGPSLTSAQTTRLLLGHLSLTHLWDSRLQVHAPAIPAPSAGACTYHQHGCHFVWVNAWRDAARSAATVKHQTHDVMGRVRSMEKQLVGNEALIVALTPACRRKALYAVRETVRGLEESLGEHFRGIGAVN